MKTYETGLTSYSLGLEELSLALMLINQPDLAGVLMQSVYPGITDSQLDARFTSAGNSLLARNLCIMSSYHKPQLTEKFQFALFPLAIYDYLLQITTRSKSIELNTTIHVQRNQRFTGHSIKQGVIHVVDHANIGMLLQYLLGHFPTMPKKHVSGEAVGKMPQDLLNPSSKDLNPETALIDLGWVKTYAKEFNEDLIRSVLRSFITKVNTKSNTKIEESLNAEKHTIGIIQGKNRTWLIEFPVGNPQLGNVQLANEINIKEMLKSFIS